MLPNRKLSYFHIIKLASWPRFNWLTFWIDKYAMYCYIHYTYCCIPFQNMAILPSSDLCAVRGWRTGWWRWPAKSLSGCNLSCSVTWDPRHHHEYSPASTLTSTTAPGSMLISTYNPNYYLLTGPRNRKSLYCNMFCTRPCQQQYFLQHCPCRIVSKLLFVRSPNRRKKSCWQYLWNWRKETNTT